MTPNPHKHDDTKILLAVAGAVVAGAAALALVAGLGTEDAPSPRQAERAAATPKPAAAEPAVKFDSPSGVEPAIEVARRVETPVPSIDVGPAVDAEPAPIEIAPGENLVAGGLAAWNARDYRRAAAYFAAQAEARDSDAWARYMLGLSLWKDGRADEAVPAMRSSAELDPSFIRTPLNLARIENDRGEFEAALAAARAALAIDPDSGEAKFLEGRSLNNLGRRDEAIAALEHSVALAPDNGYAHNLLGLVLLETGESERAADTLQRAAELLPEVAYVQNNLGMACEHCGDRSAAVAAYRRAVELDAGHERAVKNLARLEPLAPAGSAPGTGAVAGAADSAGEVEVAAVSAASESSE